MECETISVCFGFLIGHEGKEHTLSKPVFQTHEWGRLHLPNTYDTRRVREHLLAVGQTSLGAVFRSTGRALYARDLVGLIDGGAFQVQIVPKLYPDSNSEQEAQVFLDIILDSLLPVHASAKSARIVEKYGSVLDAVCGHIAGLIQVLLFQGLPRRYSSQQEIGQTVRGRIDLNLMARRRPGGDQVVPIKHAPLRFDNPLARLVRAIIERLHGINRRARTNAVLLRCAAALHGVKSVPLTAALVDAVGLSRSEEGWADILAFARTLTKGMTSDVVRAGPQPGTALLFSLDYLFESLTPLLISMRPVLQSACDCDLSRLWLMHIR